MAEFEKHGYEVPTPELIKTPAQIEKIRASAKINTGVLDAVAAVIHEGMSTQEIDDVVSSYTKLHGAVCAPLHFEGYPKSVCTSINEEVCHGIPSRLRKLRDGDIVNVDVSTILDGYYSDASRMFMMFTNVNAEGTLFVYYGPLSYIVTDVIKTKFDEHFGFDPDIISRKQQLMPKLSAILQSMEQKCATLPDSCGRVSS